MPGHIYVLCGDYEKARLVSRKALRAQRHRVCRTKELP